ncbi:MAG: NUDIX hydrolase [Parasporobacterium sp.]|nr:NUDIX hydrolase [Parasporobacterium sp.]
MEDKDLIWEEIKTEHIIQDEWIDFRRSTYRYPDGKVFEPYYSYSRRDYVVIVATDEEGRFLCVRQFRQGIGEVTTEFPAGGIERKDGREYAGRGLRENSSDSAMRELREDPSDSAAIKSRTQSSNDDIRKLREDPLETAMRELREETGYVSDEWEHLLTIPSNATISDNYAYIYRAKNCRQAGEQELDETEYLKALRLSSGELRNLIAEGKFQQAVHVMAWLLAKDEQSAKDGQSAKD